MSKIFNLTVLSAERELYSGEAEALTIETEMGEITVMADHLPLVSNLMPGELKIQKTGNQTDWMFVGGGVLEFGQDNECRVLADVAERVEEIDAERADEARKRAEETLKSAKSEPDVAEAKAALLRAMARLRIAEKNRKLRARR